MSYYENSKGEITGRLYETDSGWVAEVGRFNRKAKFCQFFANRSARFKKFRQAEKYLYDAGCVTVAIA